MKRPNPSPIRVEPFAERVRRLREERGWSQNELAEAADLAPAALSRVLSGERELRMEHLVALAWSLEITLTELVAGTTAAGIVIEWIPRARFEDSEKTRVGALRERDAARADAAARGAEADSLTLAVATLNERLDARERELVESRVEAETARAQRRELLQLRRKTTALEAHSRSLQVEVQSLRAALDRSNLEAGEYRQRWEETCLRSRQLRADLSKAKGGNLAAGALGLFLGAVLKSENPRRRGPSA
jgi:transcriptional regulator with XRE-family HTH domain